MSDQANSTNPQGREIVVAVDGSEASNTAVLWAANAAVKRNQPLKLVSAYTMPQFMYADGMVPPQELYDDLEGEANDRIETAKELVKGFDADIQITEEIKESSPIDLLLDLSETAEMIVMGSRGLGGLSGLVMGSVSAAVVSHAQCPVVVVRKDGDVTPESKYGPVVVGVDGSEISRQAVEEAFREADARGAALTAVHAWNDSQFYASYAGLAAGEAERDEHTKLLADELVPLQKRYPNVKVEQIIARDRPINALKDASEGAQLMVLGSHGRGGFRGMLLGSTSRALLQYAPCPMMVVHPRKK